MDKIEVEHNLLSGHSYITTYERTNVYCPNCSKQMIWESGEDEELGPRGYCLNCNFFHFCCGDFYPIRGEDLVDIKIIKSKVG